MKDILINIDSLETQYRRNFEWNALKPNSHFNCKYEINVNKDLIKKQKDANKVGYVMV